MKNQSHPDELLAMEIQKSVDDPRPSVPHDEVMTRMDVRIARHSPTKPKVAKPGSVPTSGRRSV